MGQAPVGLNITVDTTHLEQHIITQVSLLKGAVMDEIQNLRDSVEEMGGSIAREQQRVIADIDALKGKVDELATSLEQQGIDRAALADIDQSIDSLRAGVDQFDPVPDQPAPDQEPAPPEENPQP